MDAYTHALTNISALGLILGAVTIMVVSSLWYSPLLFGKSWARHTGIRPHDIRPAEARRGYAFAAFSALLVSYLVGIVGAHATSIPALIASVAFIWLFIMLEQFNSFIWERAAFALFIIHTMRNLATLIAAALVHHFIGAL